ncbi:hypothetical protein [Ruegeria sp. Ofav3-42]|uniref:hypothetical protein n=1 Tax=Ruegeria sp. Ofav3-42 TaxID=2917759 RepID=UPI001EF42464|nr:hypothetical protein [Ruegeria sp. Ofav3-42]MCG7521924.1 hypothetical protein [Ruegeria sp. Ofav3-42]
MTFGLSGCAANVSSADKPVFTLTYTDGSASHVAGTGSGLHKVAQEVSGEYVSLADRVSTTQDVTSVALIGIATYAAYGVIDGFSASRLAEIALGGFALNASVNYFDPRATTTALLEGARRASCLSGVALQISTVSSTDGRFVAVHQALLKNSILIRTAMQRDIPNYLAILNQAQNIKIPAGTESNFGFESTASVASIEEVEAGIETCFDSG